MKTLYEMKNKKLQFLLGYLFSAVIPTIWGMFVIRFTVPEKFNKHTALFYFIALLIAFTAAAILIAFLRKTTDNLYVKKKEFFDKNEKIIITTFICICALLMLFVVIYTVKVTNSAIVSALCCITAIPFGYLCNDGCKCINFALGTEKYGSEVN